MADTSRRLAGTAFLSIDGRQYMLAGDLSWSVSTVSRETMAGMDGIHGYSEKPNAGYIAGTFRDSGGLTIADFNAMTNVSVVCELANGKIVIGRNMWTVAAQEVKSGEGTVEVRFEGEFVEEM